MRDVLQAALDAALYPQVLSYWQCKSGDADEYIVYSRSGSSIEGSADDAPLVKAENMTIRYYYRGTKISDYAGRQAVEAREDAIQAAVENAGFFLPSGRFDAGDIDDIGFFVTVFECEYWGIA
ncbi:hypothetical protein [Bacteroides sp.]|uniref:hypothetical protein n=1 Tax=Bacteroides sp. TaxID=29523 RepID=UPI00261682DA|nr:hypothetical protein [Bacteroides sp.]MDD3040778.1 hypothetical protein [Bacteroides sp.]